MGDRRTQLTLICTTTPNNCALLASRTANATLKDDTPTNTIRIGGGAKLSGKIITAEGTVAITTLLPKIDAWADCKREGSQLDSDEQITPLLTTS
jgi:hypothetical protein